MSSSGCSKSSASGIVHADAARAGAGLAVGHEVFAAVDGKPPGADDHFLTAKYQVQEHRNPPGMLGAEVTNGREHGARILAGRHADPASVRLAHAAVLRAAAVVRERLLEQAEAFGGAERAAAPAVHRA